MMAGPSPITLCRTSAIALLSCCWVGLAAGAAEPRSVALRQDDHGVTVEAAGRPFASYVVDESNKPYLWPVFGPTGKAMTRADPMQDIPEEPAGKPVLVERRRLTFRADEAAGGVAAAWQAYARETPKPLSAAR